MFFLLGVPKKLGTQSFDPEPQGLATGWGHLQSLSLRQIILASHSLDFFLTLNFPSRELLYGQSHLDGLYLFFKIGDFVPQGTFSKVWRYFITEDGIGVTGI